MAEIPTAFSDLMNSPRAFAHLATVSPNGAPQVTPVWFDVLDGKVLVGFAGSTADAFALMERFEAKVKDYPGNIARAATELARDWRTDRALRRLEAMMLVADSELTLLLTGQGDVVQPTDGVVGIGSGGAYATSAAKALVRHSSLSAESIVRESLAVAAEIDIYTNNNIIVEQLQSET
jgi:ATP-dependent HslUV protease subunit HslV